ncbi:unnamed protein product [Leuciscus chuanchicus]
MAASAKKKSRHWTREETLFLIKVWGEPRYQRQFKQMVHNHTVWENIYKDLGLRCPSIQDFGDWTKSKERLDCLRRKYRDGLKNNKKTGTNPIKCPYFDELDAVLCCRPMNNPGDIRMDNGGCSDEESDCAGSSESPNDHNTSRKMMQRMRHPVMAQPPKHHHPHLLLLLNPSHKHIAEERGEKQIMEAIDKGLDRLLLNENTHDYDREWFEWEKEMERNRMELERKRLDFEIKKMEADEKRAEENRALMLQMFQCFRPQSQHSTFSAPHYYPYTPPHQRPSAESMDFPPTTPGPPAPAAYQVHYYNDPPN